MFVLGESKTEYTKSHKLKKATFKQFLALRYGNTVAEKWQNLLDFNNLMDFEAFC